MTSPASKDFVVEIFHSPKTYLGFCAEFIAQDPYSTNVISVVAAGIAAGSRDLGPTDIFIALCLNNTVMGMAMHTPPYHLFLSGLPETAAIRLAASLFEQQRPIGGVNGELKAVQAFAGAWTSLTGTKSRLETSTRLYKLKALHPPTGVQGRPKVATISDLELVTNWLTRFHDEAEPNGPQDDVKKTAARRIKDGEIHLWIQNDKPVALAGRRPAVYGVARIGPVYTPKPSRGQGFGSAVTAAATQFALEQGASHVALYTDLSNPTSNSIYQKIGYSPDQDGAVVVFR